MEVQYPDILKGGHLTDTRQLIKACPPEQRQPVLGEIGAMHARALLLRQSHSFHVAK